jgi:hypothetical protein
MVIAPTAPEDDDGFESDEKDDPDSVPLAVEETLSTTESISVLYQVVSTHPYVREDEDELTFNARDVINVYPVEEDEPDEGWLFG